MVMGIYLEKLSEGGIEKGRARERGGRERQLVRVRGRERE